MTAAWQHILRFQTEKTASRYITCDTVCNYVLKYPLPALNYYSLPCLYYTIHFHLQTTPTISLIPFSESDTFLNNSNFSTSITPSCWTYSINTNTASIFCCFRLFPLLLFTDRVLSHFLNRYEKF